MGQFNLFSIGADIINYKSVLKLNQLAISVGYLLCANGNVVFVSKHISAVQQNRAPVFYITWSM